MKRQIAFCILALTVLWAGLAATAQTLDAEEILDQIRGSWQGDSFHAVLSLEVTLGEQTKSHVLEVWTLGDDYALLRIIEPEIDAGSGYLQVGDDLWYYSPSIGTSIKLPAIAIADAIFGSGPSIADLSHSTLSDDYDAIAQVAGDGFLLTLVPHANAPVVYGKLELFVSADYVIQQIVYYDQREAVLRTATFSNMIEIDGRVLPTLIVIEDASGNRTTERIENPEYNLDLDPSFFTIKNLEGSE